MVTKKHIAETLKEVLASKDINLTVAQCEYCVSTVVQAMANGIVNVGELRLDGFGSFKGKNVPDRKCHNPRTGEVIIAPAHKSIVFKVAKGLYDKLNEKE